MHYLSTPSRARIVLEKNSGTCGTSLLLITSTGTCKLFLGTCWYTHDFIAVSRALCRACCILPAPLTFPDKCSPVLTDNIIQAPLSLTGSGYAVAWYRGVVGSGGGGAKNGGRLRSAGPLHTTQAIFQSTLQYPLSLPTHLTAAAIRANFRLWTY
jgi:hypothetical protein